MIEPGSGTAVTSSELTTLADADTPAKKVNVVVDEIV
jgi:hypothetical protein